MPEGEPPSPRFGCCLCTRHCFLLSLFNIHQSNWTYLDTDSPPCPPPPSTPHSNGLSKPRPVDNYPLSSAYLAVCCHHIYTARRRWARRRQCMWQVLCELFHSRYRLKDVSGNVHQVRLPVVTNIAGGSAIIYSGSTCPYLCSLGATMHQQFVIELSAASLCRQSR